MMGRWREVVEEVRNGRLRRGGSDHGIGGKGGERIGEREGDGLFHEVAEVCQLFFHELVLCVKQFNLCCNLKIISKYLF